MGRKVCFVNSNRMFPAIGPLGLEYIGCAVRQAGFDADLVDLSLADDADGALEGYFGSAEPELVGLSFRNVDDCFWPSCTSFLDDLRDLVQRIKGLCQAPVVIGGVGYSIFPERIVEHCGADFGVRGDGERSVLELLNQLAGGREFAKVGGLVWRSDEGLVSNEPLWGEPVELPVGRDFIDNAEYFRRGGQAGFETKRGCNRACIYCADPLSKGTKIRLRGPGEVADEIESLLKQGIDVLHTCDAEFNTSGAHAKAVCEEFARRGLGEKVRWYAYMAVTPFDAEIAGLMRRAGCVGINFTGDSGCEKMLRAYRQRHGRDDLGRAVELCRDNGMKVMIDLLLGGPGETVETAAESIEYVKRIGPDCAGAPVGIRVYPGTAMAEMLLSDERGVDNPSLRRKYDGPIDLLQPTFFISHEMGERPSELVQDLIDGDERFFEPVEDLGAESKDHNYNDNSDLVEAIAAGARGAYWDILKSKR